jgi:ABC-type dipeptide/oligopeptide/nickel transport system permease component
VTSTFWLYLGRRVLASLLFVLLVSSSALVLARLMPGDATASLVLSGADRASVDAARVRLGLDQPVYVQLRDWLIGVSRLELGRSSRFNQPVSRLLGGRLGRTASLAALALLLATLIGIPAGVVTGSRPHSRLARAIAPVSTTLIACPPLIAVFALLLFAATTGLLSVAPGSYAVPTLALALPIAAGLERLQAQAMEDVLAAPDVAAAAARGVTPMRLIWVHAARQALQPVLGVYGIVIGSLFSGSLAVEVVTSWPGLGWLTYEALIARDLYLLAGCALAGAAFIAAGNLAADALRALADPRVRDGWV